MATTSNKFSTAKKTSTQLTPKSISLGQDWTSSFASGWQHSCIAKFSFYGEKKLPQRSAKVQRSSSMMPPSKMCLGVKVWLIKNQGLAVSSLQEETPKMWFCINYPQQWGRILRKSKATIDSFFLRNKLPSTLITKEMLHQPMIKTFEIPSKDAMT